VQLTSTNSSIGLIYALKKIFMTKKKKKNILIIGCLGHIGYSLSVYLSQKYNIVATYNNTSNKNLLKNLKSKNIKLFKVDVSNKKLFKKILGKFNFDTCVYAAAVAHDYIAKHNTEKTIKANCQGVINFLNFNKKNCKLIYISTGSVFQNIKSSKDRISENVKPSPASLYSVSKRFGELLIENDYPKKKNVYGIKSFLGLRPTNN
jgi:dTDP-4-dehydrorhamnose reductase